MNARNHDNSPFQAPMGAGTRDPVPGIDCMPRSDSAWGKVTSLQSPRNHDFGDRVTW